MTEHFVVMTVQGVQDGGTFRTQTLTATGAFGTSTRAEVFAWMKEQLAPELRTLPVVFFSVEPNNLTRPEGDK